MHHPNTMGTKVDATIDYRYNPSDGAAVTVYDLAGSHNIRRIPIKTREMEIK